MNINELSQFGDDCSLPLRVLYKNSGSCAMNGYLGENIRDLSFDEEGRVEFSTHKEFPDTVVDSKGVVLSDSVLIKQVQKGHSSNGYRLYSWDVDNNQYTYLALDDEKSLNRFYDVIKRFDMNLCDDDISSLFREMGLTFDAVTQVLMNQRRNPMDAMFDEEPSKEEDSFVK